MTKKKAPPEPRKGAPAYMVSFGDMMTLILCFFILLVSMSKERNHGLVAQGVGSFIAAVESHGLNGVLSGREKQEIFDRVRRRFRLPPVEDPERRELNTEASQFELLRAKILEALEPHGEIRRPRIARFTPDSSVLAPAAREELDRLADTLMPAHRQILLLEGHALDAGQRFGGDNVWLAYMRAEEVRQYFIAEHGFKPDRVEARAWFEELSETASGTVDARLITPKPSQAD